MKAYRFHQWKQPGRLEDIPIPRPGPGEALVRIGGSGACHPDLHVMHEWSPEVVPQLAGIFHLPWGMRMPAGSKGARHQSWKSALR